MSLRARDPLARQHRARGIRTQQRLRAQITSARRGKRPAGQTTAPKPEQYRAVTWARHLKRVFRIDVEVCKHRYAATKITACIEHPDVIERILGRLRGKHEGNKQLGTGLRMWSQPASLD